MSGIERRVVYFRKMLFETDNEKFCLGRVKCKKVSRHPSSMRKLVAEQSGDGR